MNSGDLDFLTAYLGKVTDLRKDSERIHVVLETEDILSNPLYEVTSEIVRGILSDYDPETMESFVSAIRKGSLDLEKSKERSPE